MPAGRLAEAIDLVPEAVVDTMTITGNVEQCAASVFVNMKVADRCDSLARTGQPDDTHTLADYADLFQLMKRFRQLREFTGEEIRKADDKAGLSDSECCRRLQRFCCEISTFKTEQGRRRSTVLFVHGATYGSTYTFDYQISGQSWMDHLAAQGFDVWCLDLLGYGLSDRPTVMDQPAEENPPMR